MMAHEWMLAWGIGCEQNVETQKLGVNEKGMETQEDGLARELG